MGESNLPTQVEEQSSTELLLPAQRGAPRVLCIHTAVTICSQAKQNVTELLSSKVFLS